MARLGQIPYLPGKIPNQICELEMAYHGKEDEVEEEHQPYASRVELEEVKRSVDLIMKGQLEHIQQMENYNKQLGQLTMVVNALVIQSTQRDQVHLEPSDRFSSYRGNLVNQNSSALANLPPASVVWSCGANLPISGVSANQAQYGIMAPVPKLLNFHSTFVAEGSINPQSTRILMST